MTEFKDFIEYQLENDDGIYNQLMHSGNASFHKDELKAMIFAKEHLIEILCGLLNSYYEDKYKLDMLYLANDLMRKEIKHLNNEYLIQQKKYDKKSKEIEQERGNELSVINEANNIYKDIKKITEKIKRLENKKK